MKRMTRYLAAFITATAMAMAAMAAWDRGGNAVDRALLVALSIAICAGTHLIPALTKRKLAWLLWVGCLLGTVYGHLVFFTHASIRAGEGRAQHSFQTKGVAQQAEAVHAALSGISARPVAVVAAELAGEQSSRRRSALRLELEEARRAAALRDELVALADTATAVQVIAASDPVTARLSEVTGSSEAGITVVIGIGLSVLLELIGALLWCEALRHSDQEGQSEPVNLTKPDSLSQLKAAVSAGLCKPTVSGIRVYLGCGQTKAMDLRRALLAA